MPLDDWSNPWNLTAAPGYDWSRPPAAAIDWRDVPATGEVPVNPDAVPPGVDIPWDFWEQAQSQDVPNPDARTTWPPQWANVPGEITPGITPGEWSTIRGPHQLGFSLEQALAEYQARLAHPRSGIPDDLQENLQKELLSPFTMGMAIGAKAVAPPAKKFIKSGSAVLTPNEKGELEVAYPGQEKPLPLDEATKSRKALLESRIKHTRNLIASAGENEPEKWKPLIDQALRDEEELKALLENIVRKPAVKAAAPVAAMPIRRVSSAAEAAALTDSFGGPGNRTPFVFSGAAAPPPVQSFTNRVRNIRRLR